MIFIKFFALGMFGIFFTVTKAEKIITYPKNNPVIYPTSRENDLEFRQDDNDVEKVLHDHKVITYPKDEDNPKLGAFIRRPPSKHRSSSSSSSEETGEHFRRRDRKQQRNGNRRICEKKYSEYVSLIFRNDNDTVADADDTDFDGRILAQPAEYPHMAALGFVEEGKPVDYQCGGSLISENYVITAAHCTNLSGATPTKVRIGDLNLMVEETNLQPQIRNIKTILNHPNYKSNSYYNDIALLELESPIEFTEFVRPIRLYTRSELPTNASASAMGYGSTSFAKMRTNRLTHFNLTLISNDLCSQQMSVMPEAANGIIESQICARDYALGRDTCQGDSGGPLQLNIRGRRRRNRVHYQLVGITSYGLYCRSPYPSVYTRVTYFLDWIENTVWPEEK